MGVLDFLKQGVGEMVIKRPDEKKDELIWKWPDPTIPTYAQLTIDADECAVFFRDGAVVGTLRTAGVGKRHTLSSENLPFVSILMDKVTEGRFLTTALFFVLMRPKYNIPFGGELDPVRDPTLGEAVTPRIFGTFSIQVEDPEAFIVKFNGVRQGSDDLRWIKDRFMNTIATMIGDLMENQQQDWFKVRSNRNKLIEQVLAGAPSFQEIGCKIVDIGKFQLNLDEADEERIRQAQSEIGQAKRRADIAASAGVREAEAKAKQRQFELDQEAAQRARYAQMATAPGFGAAAQAEVMYGAAKGVAQGGEGGGAMTGGAGLGLGFGMAQMFAGGMQSPGAAPPAPPLAPGVPVLALHTSGRWVPGKVVQLHGAYIGVQWDDVSLGQPVWLTAQQVTPAMPPAPPMAPMGPPPGPPVAGPSGPQGVPPGLGTPAPAAALGVGSLVQAQAPDGGWYSARIVQIEGGVFGVAWENPALGNGAWVQAYQVRPR